MWMSINCAMHCSLYLQSRYLVNGNGQKRIKSNLHAHSLGSQEHVFAGVDLVTFHMWSAQVLCDRFRWKLRLTHVAEISGEVHSLPCK